MWGHHSLSKEAILRGSEKRAGLSGQESDESKQIEQMEALNTRERTFHI
jgi:hypothetical protein